MKHVLKVSMRQQALFVPKEAMTLNSAPLTEETGVLVANLAKAGYGVSEKLLQALNAATPAYHAAVWECVKEITGIDKNWTPLVKGWDKPNGETVMDHVVTFFANLFQQKGIKLACGHIIPDNTFPLERYNGCPFCGMPFEAGAIEHFKQGSIVKTLELWTENEVANYYINLLTSKTALDATQMDSLKLLLSERPLPQVAIGMKETVIAVIDSLVEQQRSGEAQALFTSPTDILRYLWYKHTGQLQLVEPKVLIGRAAKNNRHLHAALDQSASARLLSRAGLKLKYNRKQCVMVARWMNTLDMDVQRMCEVMHPKRGMWVRFIRALRLAEYSRRSGFEKLKEVLHLFYTQNYEVWQGKVDQYRLRYDAAKTFGLLQQRPGMFARSLFANMLWFGPERTIDAFKEVVDKVPARLVFTLNMYAEKYFDSTSQRMVKPLGGVAKAVAPHPLLAHYSQEQLGAMQAAVQHVSLVAAEKRFAAVVTENQTMYIDPTLYKIPLAIGDRSGTVQDLSAALMGTRFPVEGDTIRLFMQWGNGLKAQHLDMDLSCHIGYESTAEVCSFSRLVATGCKHSGDIRFIPNQVGTAEYIDMDLLALAQAGAKYVAFTCNAYSNGSLSPNLVVGWMNSKYPMKISEKTGVAYDPSCVQHQVRITGTLTKGLVFGVLDVAQREIIWLELPFQGQLVQQLDANNIARFLRKLESKLSIGQLLEIKAKAQHLKLVSTPDADENYTRAWAMDTAGVTQLLEG
jgi:hypothetical protein